MSTEPQLRDIDILEDIPDLIDIPEEILLDFDAWAHSVLGLSVESWHSMNIWHLKFWTLMNIACTAIVIFAFILNN